MKNKLLCVLGIVSTMGVCLYGTELKAADLIGAVQVDTKFNLKVVWSGNLGDGQNNNLLAPTLNNWSVAATVLEYKGGTKGWSGEMGVKHTADPHPELGENGGGNPVKLQINFTNDPPNPPGKVTGSSNTFADHSPVHSDIYRLTYSFTPAATKNFTATLTGGHIPCQAERAVCIPEPITILGTGVVLGLLPAFKKAQGKKHQN